ncbi:MAG TPA: group II intron reverse transcriptase/maturase [Terriglobia bacterium]|nr:group II intron reverse transcriptase/maturase [Terriglobia bacterium]
MTAKQEEERPAAVPEAKQAGEVRARWAWAEPRVWTERMLTALEVGVKGGKWFSLIDKVSAPRVLRRAFEQVKANGGAAGVDHQTIAMYEQRLEQHTESLACRLREGSYQPAAVRREWIPKPGSREKRPLGIPTVRDRVVEKALQVTIEPIFERDFAEQSYGFRPGRGCKDALRRVDQLLKQGLKWVVDADLKSYFDTIPHEQLLKLIEGKVADGRVLELLRKYLKQGVLEDMREWQPEAGTPQGAVISPLLSNIYLNPLDHLMESFGYEMIRYADDFVVLCHSEAEARRALAAVQQWTVEAGLTLHPNKTRIVDATQPGGFDFLGYHFECGRKTPRQKSLKKFKDTIRAKTKRTNGHSLQVIIANVNRTAKGWFTYFKHSHLYTFRPLDQFIRTRLRSIIRSRNGRRGMSRGGESRQWTNAFFAQQGLFSLLDTRVALRQSLRR